MNDIPAEIKDLIIEACSLEYCPDAVRAWCVEVLSTDSLPYLPVIKVDWGYRYWSGFTESVYWAFLYIEKKGSPGYDYAYKVRLKKAREAIADIQELYPLREEYVEHP